MLLTLICLQLLVQCLSAELLMTIVSEWPLSLQLHSFFIIQTFIYFTAIRIGFQLSSYTYFESEFDTFITNVTLIKEDNVETEQVLSIALTYTDGTAVIGEDYTLGGTDGSNTQIRNILPTQQSITLTFVLLPDDISEGTESFTISAAGNQGFPSSETPILTFASTTILIMDNDRKCLL